jgi:hypothetical protein
MEASASTHPWLGAPVRRYELWSLPCIAATDLRRAVRSLRSCASASQAEGAECRGSNRSTAVTRRRRPTLVQLRASALAGLRSRRPRSLRRRAHSRYFGFRAGHPNPAQNPKCGDLRHGAARTNNMSSRRADARQRLPSGFHRPLRRDHRRGGKSENARLD